MFFRHLLDAFKRWAKEYSIDDQIAAELYDKYFVLEYNHK